ncbi:MAG: bifunctional precorrin-2 dehydrogenase/sirohydrochlorin ferrochelatase [Cyclobacteriaceae bacterium]
MTLIKSDISGNRLFPIFLKMDQIETLIVGGGAVGLEKITGILKNDPLANIKLVAPEIRDEIRVLAQQFPNVLLIERNFEVQDLDGIDLAVLATANRETNFEIRKQTKARGIITNVADTPDLCDFYLGSTVKKGNLKLGISTNGKSPTVSKRLRQLFEEVLPEEMDELLNNLKAVRDSLQGDFEYKVNRLNEITAEFLNYKNPPLKGVDDPDKYRDDRSNRVDVYVPTKITIQ